MRPDVMAGSRDVVLGMEEGTSSKAPSRTRLPRMRPSRAPGSPSSRISTRASSTPSPTPGDTSASGPFPWPTTRSSSRPTTGTRASPSWPAPWSPRCSSSSAPRATRAGSCQRRARPRRGSRSCCMSPCSNPTCASPPRTPRGASPSWRRAPGRTSSSPRPRRMTPSPPWRALPARTWCSRSSPAGSSKAPCATTPGSRSRVRGSGRVAWVSGFAELGQTLTDASGHYRRARCQRSVFIQASAAQYLDADTSLHPFHPDTDPLDFTLKRAFSVEGFLVDDEGQPLAGLEVRLLGGSPSDPARNALIEDRSLRRGRALRRGDRTRRLRVA